MLLCLNMTPGEETERKGQDRTVLGDTSRVGDVTGRKKAEEKRICCFGVLVPKKLRQKKADSLYVWSIPQTTVNEALFNFCTAM